MEIRVKRLVEIETTPQQLIALAERLRKRFDNASPGQTNPFEDFEQVDSLTGEVTIVQFKVNQEEASHEKKKGRW